MAGIEESQFRVFDLDGERVNVPVRKAAEFTAANPSAQELRRYRAPGMDEDFWVRDGQTPPDGAERVYRFRSEDGVVNVPRGKLGGYIGSRAAPDKDRSWGSYAGEAYADAAKAVGHAVGTVASNAADVARRIPAAAEGFLDRAAVAPVLLAGRVADALNPDPLAGPVDVLTGQRGRFSPQEMGYAEDPYRQGAASRTADKARAWLARRDEARAPKTAAGRVADVPVSFAAQLGGYATPAGPLMMVGNAAAAGDRAYAEGASGAQALGRTALSLGAQAAAFGPKPLPVPGANAAGRVVEGAAARIGGRLAQTPEGAARAVRTAVTAGQVARGAVESGARMAGVTAAEGGDAKEIAIAGAVGGVLGGTVRGVATRPLARAAGETAREIAPPGGRGPRVVDADWQARPQGASEAATMGGAGEARAAREAANRAAATARTPEGDASLAEASAKMQAASDPLAKLRAAEETAGARAREAQQKWYDAAKRRDFKEAERLRREFDALDEEYDAARRARIAAEEEPEPPAAPQQEPTPPQIPSPARGALPAPTEPGAVPTVYGQRTIVPPYYGPTVSRPGEPIAPPAPYADKVPEPIPETREEIVRRRKEALDALPLPQRLKKTGFSAYYDQHPDRAGVLDAIGFEKFSKLYRKYKGDFRNVTGDLVDASEVGGIVGRDYSGSDGVRRALEDAAQEYAGYREWKEQGAPTAEEEMQTGQEVAWNKQQNAEAEAEVRRRYELTHPEATGEPRVTDEMIRNAAAAAEEGEVARIEAEAISEEPSRGGVDTPPRDFALDGGTPAEIDAEKARAAEAQKRAALEEAAAAPGKDLGTVTIQEGLPGIGGDGTLFTPPAGGWSGRRAGARADVAAETPRAAGAPAPESPHEGLRTKLRVLVDSGATPDELEAFAREAEASDAFATAALARQRAGTYRGTPWGTEGGNWPHEEPPAARASFGDLFTLAQRLGDGKAPSVLRRISRRPWAAGVFRFVEGDPKSGSVEQLSREFELTTPEQRAEILAKARKQAEAEGGTPSAIEARAQELYDRLYERAWRDAAFAGPKQAMAVLAHEIGHWIDFLDEGTLKRGNVLGHLAALKKYLGGTLFPTKAAADAAGMPGVSQEAVKAAAKEWGVTQKEARERLTAGADLKNLPEIRREMESLVAWFRQSDGAPDYFRKDPAELYAEAFSAWVNYPAEAARRAPEFSELLDGWLEARPEAARALEEFRSGVTQAEARAAKAAGDTTNPAFFAARSEEAEAARWWQRRRAAAAERLAARTPREQVEDATDALRVLFAGPLTVIRTDVMDAGRGGRAFAPENRPLWRAMQQRENTPNLMALWDYRFRSKVLPALGDAPYPAFLEYLKNYRIANERLGPEGTRGRMNLPNPGGTTPGDVTRAEGNAQTSAAAWIHEMQRTQPELYAKLEAGRKALWDVVRNGNDELGGEGSPMQIVRDSPCLSEEQKKAINGNEAFASFSTDDLADPSRPMSSEQQSQWDGIFSQRVGSFKDPGDVLANTFNADRSMISHLARMELALRTVDWYRANKPDMVGEKCEVRVGPGGRKEVVQGQRKGWRTVTFLRDGEPEGWWVKTQLADAIELPGRGERSWDGWMGLVSKGKRALNAAQTSWNPVFNTNNSLAKDPHSLALRLPTYKVRGKGILQGTANALGNVFGHYGSQLASYLDSSGADYAKGRWNPDTARALAWGAVNNAAPGSTAYADTAGGGAKALEMGLRDLGLADQKLGDEARKQLLKARGLTEAQIEAGMRSVDGTLRRVAEAWDRLGKVPRGLRKAYPAFLSWMQHGEIRTKSFALKEILKERPDLSREEAVEIARKQIGTPDMANKPVVDRNPLTGFALFQYFTPRMHGWLEQMIDPIVRSGYTGGRKEQVSRLSRLVVAAALLSWPFLRELDLHQTRKDLSDEEERKRRAGDLPGAQRVRERLDEVEKEERYLQSIPTRDKFTKIIVPGVRGKDGNRALGFSVDPTITPLTTALLGTMFGQGYGVGPGAALREGLGTEVLPGFAPAATVAYGLARDFDPNTGRPIGKTVGDRAAWAAEALTGRSLGTGLISWGLELLAPKDDPRAEERKARQDVPVLSAIWRPFWRKTGYGLVEKAGAMRAAQEENNAKKSDISERIVMGRPVSDEEKEWFVRHAANPGESLRAAAERVWKMRNWTPDQRAADSLGKLDRREIEERFHYIRPPRLTDEDRAR